MQYDRVESRAMAKRSTETSSWGAGGQFTATRWSVVLAAGGEEADTVRRRALEELVQAYWFPLYAYIRRQGHSVQQAEDLTQEFFARLLEKKHLASADRSRGRFRSFLLTALKRFMVNEWDRSQAQKRGGGKRFISLDSLDAEKRYAVEPVDEMTPDRLFDRRWAMAVLDEVLRRLRQEYVDRGKVQLFDAIQGSLADDPDAEYGHIARELGMTGGAVKVAAHRLRRRYRQLLREEIAQTVAGPEEVEEEIRHLMECL
jgi:RNA polymerase sigma factor (sigma-70 family)